MASGEEATVTGRRMVVTLVLGAVASTALLSGCAQEYKTTGPYTPTATAISPGWISGKKAVSIAIERFGGTYESVTDWTKDGQPVWQVAITGTDRGDLIVIVDQHNGKILDSSPL
ncbi:MAG TPA: PepSY domain-containing protein [Segeticoccus sp.]|uniref:PepSY domain-containing protein n=1 Tax=Segeticoccus sp. TaxID=2706531 RepID=UPI002D7F777E|nr:PepSY domain-containing protein [Segeticoccus sp.]HET8599008.1 PepSY domain-containing protein [Segeticoccus sp.]